MTFRMDYFSETPIHIYDNDRSPATRMSILLPRPYTFLHLLFFPRLDQAQTPCISAYERRVSL